MAYFVLGSEGFFGKRIAEKFKNKQEIIPLKDRINSETDAQELFKKFNIKAGDSLINCAGKTGVPNVDWCETHRKETFLSNVLVPYWLSKACEANACRLVHFSTGCIFEGENKGKGFSEQDRPNYFGSFYSRSKVMAEEVLGDNALVLRLRMPVDSIPSGRNLITKLASYERIISVKNSITVVDDFLKAFETLVFDKNAVGVFNIVNPQPVTHKQIAGLYSAIVDKHKKFKFMSLEELKKKTLASRSNCVLSTKKLESLGVKLTPTVKAVKKCMLEYKKNMKS